MEQGYSKQRKRSGNPEAKSLKERQPPVTFREGFMIWLRSWKPSALKASFSKEYARTTANSRYLLQKAEDTLTGHK